MKLWRNPEWKRQTALLAGAGLLLGAAGFFISGAAALYVLFAMLVLNILFYLLTVRRYDEIETMAFEIDRILHGEERLELSNCREGDLAILRDEIYKMTVRLREQAERLQGEKSYLADSLADISHQIRTPLTSLNLAVSRMQQANFTKEGRRELLVEMKRLLSQVEWLVESLLKMSKLDAGSVEFSRERILMKGFLQQAIRTLEIPMELKNQNIVLKIEENCEFDGDYEWTMEAVMNVLKNCMDYTPDGGSILVEAKENPLFTQLVIQDSGEGISEEDLPHVFERFYRGGQAGKNSVGIGLALSRSILTRENAAIKAENAHEGGSRFTIRFYRGTI